MAISKAYDLVCNQVTGTGTGTTVALGPPVAGYRDAASVVSSADQITYVLRDGINFEIGRGSISGGNLARTTVITSSAAGNARISLSGSAQVMITFGASDLNEIRDIANSAFLLSDKASIGDVAANTPNKVITADILAAAQAPGGWENVSDSYTFDFGSAIAKKAETSNEGTFTLNVSDGSVDYSGQHRFWFFRRQFSDFGGYIAYGSMFVGALPEVHIGPNQTWMFHIYCIESGKYTILNAVNLTNGAQLRQTQNLDALASVSAATNRLPYFNGPRTMATTPFTPFARTLLDDADAAAARATLGAMSTADLPAALAGISALGIGTYIFARHVSDGTVNEGATVAGSSLRMAGAISTLWMGAVPNTVTLPAGGAVPPGTWQCMGHLGHHYDASFTGLSASLFRRIA